MKIYCAVKYIDQGYEVVYASIDEQKTVSVISEHNNQVAINEQINRDYCNLPEVKEYTKVLIHALKMNNPLPPEVHDKSFEMQWKIDRGYDSNIDWDTYGLEIIECEE